MSEGDGTIIRNFTFFIHFLFVSPDAFICTSMAPKRAEPCTKLQTIVGSEFVNYLIKSNLLISIEQLMTSHYVPNKYR